jgi:Na+-transporting NADH:ubiquinone oxidoreductase subunit F
MLQLLLSLLVISGLAALLAALLELANRFLADYGECRILVNQEKELTVIGGSPLLFTLAGEGIFLPSACGGRGTCAYCKVKVVEGGGPVLPTELPYLSEEEKEAGVRISCQVKVRNDLKITIPEELFLIKEFRARVTSMVQLTETIKGLKLEILSPEEGIKFKAGQYVQLEVPKYEKTKGTEFRAYSIASSAQESGALELMITKVPDGAVSVFVHDYLKEGQELTLRGPFGDFMLHDSDREILLIATGSGLAPIRSILFQLVKEQSPRKTTFFFGARNAKDLMYFDQLKELEGKLPDYEFVPALSRPTEEDGWEGETGRVTDLIKRRVEKGAAKDVYICGNPEMVEDCVELLKEKGIPEERIFFDKFA